MARVHDACIKTVRMCVAAAARHGVDLLPTVAALGIDAARLADPYARVPVPAVLDLWRKAAALSGDEAFGLHAAELGFARIDNAVDGALLHCATLGAACRAAARFSRLLFESERITLDRDGERARYQVHFSSVPPPPPAFVDMVAAMFVLRARRILGGAVPACDVALPRPPPADAREHRRVLGSALAWNAPAVRITFDAALLDRPAQDADPTLGQVLARHLDEQVAKLPADEDTAAAVRRVVAADLAEGPPDLGRVARRLGMSRRTLQRALGREGTRFQRLVDDTRREVALARLEDPRLTLSELAFLVGFSELSAFDRAFRRWTGKSPRAFRGGAARTA